MMCILDNKCIVYSYYECRLTCGEYGSSYINIYGKYDPERRYAKYTFDGLTFGKLTKVCLRLDSDR